MALALVMALALALVMALALALVKDPVDPGD